MAQTERRRAQDRARHARDKEKRNAARRAAHAANPEKLRARDRERYATNPLAKRASDVRSKYGPHALAAYLGTERCESCGDKVAGKSKHIDHDHSRGPKVGFRGILCASCNCALGYLREDPERVRALLGYIETRVRTGGTDMKTIEKMGAQGDVLFRRVAAVPPGFKERETKGRIVVAHSETGHHHALDATGVKLFAGEDPMRCFLQLVSVESADVVHHRPWDTHETVQLGGGAGSVYEVIRQREYTPEGWRRVED